MAIKNNPGLILIIVCAVFVTVVSLTLNWPLIVAEVRGLVGKGVPAHCYNGSVCPAPYRCCEDGCCAPTTPHTNRSLLYTKEDNMLPPWYLQWPLLFLMAFAMTTVLCCLTALACTRPGNEPCCYLSCSCCIPRQQTSERDSSGSLYPPPRYSRCGSFHQAPPPYAEVTSKPDLYPLVIACADPDGKQTSGCVMVRCLRRAAPSEECARADRTRDIDPGHQVSYHVQAPGSLSATSTAESLNSSYLCNATNEANSLVPPPYSCANNYEDYVGGGGGQLPRSASSVEPPPAPRAPPRSRTAPDPRPQPHPAPPRQAFRDNLITSPVQPLDPAFDLELELIDCEMYCDGGCKPRLGASPPAHRSPLPPSQPDTPCEREAYGLRHLFSCPETTCESPPQPTSPTQSRESTLTRPSDEKRQNKKIKRKSSLYMPLSLYPVRTSRISPGSKVSSRSAPATPCGALVPNLLNFSQRISSSRNSKSSKCEEESNPLLVEDENTRTDSKF